MNARAAAIAGFAGLMVAMLVALVTAVQSSRAGVFSMIRDGARTVEGGGQGMRAALVFAEVALAPKRLSRSQTQSASAVATGSARRRNRALCADTTGSRG
jgi:hypothetical protein